MISCNTRVVSLCLMIVCLMMPGLTRAEPIRDLTGIATAQFDPSMIVSAKAENTRSQVGSDKGLTDAEIDALKRWGSIAFIVLASCTIILFILGCGSRVVVFADSNDFILSLGMFLAPVATALVGAVVVWMMPPVDRPGATFWEAVKDNPAMSFVIAVGALWWLWSILGTIISSVRHNGIFVGLIVATLKVGAVLSLLVIWWGILSNYDRTDSFEGTTSKFFLLVILAWFASKFLNGEKVFHRRQMLQGRSQSMIEA